MLFIPRFYSTQISSPLHTFAIAIAAALLAPQRSRRPWGWGRDSRLLLLWVLLHLGLLGDSSVAGLACVWPVLEVSDVEEKVGLLGQDTGQAHLEEAKKRQ